ncbi:MAG TPA: tRNA (adenosine(37)-N6)-dimethylallyltransferase MiaA, partial [Candidatus Acidoferrum sp.]|nr:tRNA (adenosine(37)-N6)-dimethylallyltransferase MiaA [Candidatus Acidoferrum sp.]
MRDAPMRGAPPRDWPPLLVIAGSTATGKSGLAIRLAEALAAQGHVAEVVSADSRQVYRGMDIGTAKMTVLERRDVPHHGLDLVEPDVRFSVADYALAARAALTAIAGHAALAILVGGSGLYLRAVARGFDTVELPHDPELRARIERDLADRGLPALVQRLATVAPGVAATIDARNPRRVIRALERAELVGDVPPTPPKGYPGPSAWLGLDLDRAEHRTWIANRARAQFGAGLLDEAAGLRRRFDPSAPAFSAIGYHEAWAVLDGRLTLEAAIDANIGRNVAFARRQRTWFRSEPEV